MAAKGGRWKGATFIPAKGAEHVDTRVEGSSAAAGHPEAGIERALAAGALAGEQAAKRKSKLLSLAASAEKRGFPAVRVTRSLMEDYIARGGGEIPRGVPGATRRERAKLLLSELAAAVRVQGSDRHAVTFTVRAAHDSSRSATYHFKARLLNAGQPERYIAINLQKIETHGAPYITRIERGAVKRRREREEREEHRRRVREQIEAYRREREAAEVAAREARAKAELEAKRRRGPLRVEGSVGMYGPTARFKMRGEEYRVQLWPHEARPRVTRELGPGRSEAVGRVKSGKNRGDLKKSLSPEEQRVQARGERVLRAVIGRMRRTGSRTVNIKPNPFGDLV